MEISLEFQMSKLIFKEKYEDTLNLSCAKTAQWELKFNVQMFNSIFSMLNFEF